MIVEDLKVDDKVKNERLKVERGLETWFGEMGKHPLDSLKFMAADSRFSSYLTDAMGFYPDLHRKYWKLKDEMIKRKENEQTSTIFS